MFWVFLMPLSREIEYKKQYKIQCYKIYCMDIKFYTIVKRICKLTFQNVVLYQMKDYLQLKKNYRLCTASSNFQPTSQPRLQQ